MKRIFSSLAFIITAIAILVFIAGIVITLLGMYEFAIAFTHWDNVNKHQAANVLGTGLLKAVDLFLMAIVFFIFSLGFLILFSPEKLLPVKLPEWLRIKNFMQLKAILWEAILTTLVVSYLSGLAEQKVQGLQNSVDNLILPGAILIIALSLFVLKKGEGH